MLFRSCRNIAILRQGLPKRHYHSQIAMKFFHCFDFWNTLLDKDNIMMKILFLWCMLFSFQTLFAQNENFELVQDVYKQWHKFTFNDNNQCSNIYINDSIDVSVINCMKEKFQNRKKFYHAEINEAGKKILDSVEFDKSEIDYVLVQIDKLNSNRWSEKVFPKAKKISPYQFESHFSSVNFLEPIDRLCYNIYTISNPIFLRNNKICIFYNEEKSFSNVEGAFWMYVYKKKAWMKYAPVCMVQK